jgi:hypothetical protein
MRMHHSRRCCTVMQPKWCPSTGWRLLRLLLLLLRRWRGIRVSIISTILVICSICWIVISTELLALRGLLLLWWLLVMVTIILWWHRIAPLINGSPRVWIVHHLWPLEWWLRRTPHCSAGRLLRPVHTTTRLLMCKTDGLRLPPSSPLGRLIWL